MRDYKITFKALIIGETYIAAETPKKAADVFREDEDKSFDRLVRMEKYKIISVEEIIPKAT